MNSSRDYNNNKIDIVIVTYKSYEYLEKCISSIYDDASSRRFIQDIIVVDNAPSEPYWKSPPKICEKVVLLKNEENLGFARAVNLGIKNGFVPYVLLLNPDTIIHGNMIARSVAFMDQHPMVGIMGPRIFNEDGSIQGSARGFPNYSTLLFGRASPLNRIFPDNPLTRKNIPCLGIREDDTEFYQVDWISGAAAVIRRDAIEEIGYFDERFFMYWEDADLCQRMKKAAWDVVYCPNPEVTHLVGRSTEQNFVLNLARFHRSAFILEQKQERSRWPGHLVLVAVALEFHFLFRLLWRAVHGQTERRRAEVLPDKIKVLRVIARLNIGGPAIHVSLLADGLDPTRFQSTLIAGKVSPEEGDMSYIIDTSDGKPITIPQLQRELSFVKDVKSFFSFLRILDQEKPDIVHTHTAKAGAIGRLSVFVHNFIYRRKVLAIHTFHGHVFRGYFGKLKSVFFVWAERMLANITDCIIAISESQKSELYSNYHIAPESKFRVIPLGFDLAPFLACKDDSGQWPDDRRQMTEGRRQEAGDRRQRTEGRRQKAEDNFGMASPEWKIGIVGRLVPIKNHKMFLESAKIFLNQNPDIRTKFLIIGDGELRNDLAAFCERQGLSGPPASQGPALLPSGARRTGHERAGYVKFCGWKRDLAKVYAELDILCLTSLNEGTPVSIIEAMAAGVPVIATDVGGVRELIAECAPVKKASRFTGQGVRNAGVFSSRQALCGTYRLRIADCGVRNVANAELTAKEGEFEVCERGILVKPGDVEGFAKGLRYLLEHPDVCREIGQRGREYAMKHHGKERLVADMDRLYRSLLE